MKVALVHDFLTQVGGAERVLNILHDIFPQAPVYTLVYDKEETRGEFEHLDIRTSVIQKMPFGVKRYKWYLPLMPSAVEQFDLSSYDLVISDSSAYANGVITLPETLHICYCHSPTRYLWSDTHGYTDELKQPNLIKQVLPFFLNRIRVWDRVAADRVDTFIANSKTVQRRISKYYRTESDLIYPPVDIDRFSVAPKEEVEDYYLIVSRLRPYKRVDLAIEAFNALGYPLKIIGTGEEEENLKRMAKPNIEFLGALSNEKVSYYLSRCKAFIHPQEEDFGIAALEASASGRPVIAYGSGGALETIIPGVTGEFFKQQTPYQLVDLMRSFDATKYEPAVMRSHAEKFATDRFMTELKNKIDEAYKKHCETLTQ